MNEYVKISRLEYDRLVNQLKKQEEENDNLLKVVGGEKGLIVERSYYGTKIYAFEEVQNLSDAKTRFLRRRITTLENKLEESKKVILGFNNSIFCSLYKKFNKMKQP